MIRLLESNSLGKRHGAANSRLNATVVGVHSAGAERHNGAADTEETRENRPQRDNGLRQEATAVARRSEEDPLEDLANRIERLDPSTKHRFLQRFTGDSQKQNQRDKTVGERFRDR